MTTSLTRTAAYGSWPSPVTAELLVDGLRDLGYASRAGRCVYWIETDRADPADTRLMCLADGADEPVTVHRAVRSQVYGYGARPYAVRSGVVFLVHATDQQLYRLDPDGTTVALTFPGAEEPVRYGAPQPSHDGRLLYAVRERGDGLDAVHDLVVVPTAGGPLRVLAAGADFYGAPVPHPTRLRVAFTTWDHPHMPWDESTLREVHLDERGRAVDERVVTALPGVSVTQPCYSPRGRLHYVDDRSGWWNLRAEGAPDALTAMEAEFGRPDWSCGATTYGFLADGRIVAAFRVRGKDTVVRIDQGGAEPVPMRFDVVDTLATGPDDAVAVVASGTRSAAVVLLPDGAGPPVRLRSARPRPLGDEWTSRPRPIAFDSAGALVHAFYYPPHHPHVRGPAGRPPPLVVFCHGGPTVVASAVFSHQVQFWTTRGIAVVEVNYGGSAGHGRAYRERIRGRWGELDVTDCVNAARHLVAEGLADPRRLAVRGLSSGGLTALNAAASGVFAAVTSCAGVTEPAAIPDRTHKMESRYLDGLIGPWPAARDEYERRSPLRRLDSWTAAVLLFHGARDRVVPPEQAQALYQALRARGAPVELVLFPEEGHALTGPDAMARIARRELAFLAAIFGFIPDYVSGDRVTK